MKLKDDARDARHQPDEDPATIYSGDYFDRSNLHVYLPVLEVLIAKEPKTAEHPHAKGEKTRALLKLIRPTPLADEEPNKISKPRHATNIDKQRSPPERMPPCQVALRRRSD